MKHLYLTFLVLIAGCSSITDYQNPEDVGIGNEKYIVANPDIFKVRKKGAYPSYSVATEYLPPDTVTTWFGVTNKYKSAPISSTDKWIVTHTIQSNFIIQSEEYNERQCRFLEGGRNSHWYINPFGWCLSSYEYGIAINSEGRVTIGWVLLPSSRIGGAYRKKFIPLEPTYEQSWIGEKLFLNRANNQILIR